MTGHHNYSICSPIESDGDMNQELYQGSISHEKSERKRLMKYGSDDDDVPPVIRTYKSRIWIVFITSVLCWVHTLQWGTWGPISESMDAAFDGWGPNTVALMTNWGTIMYILFVIPLCWAMQRFGLRVGILASAGFMVVGTGIRCFTRQTPTFTIMCHICAILVGAASSLALTSPLVVASDWFPMHERTTAVGVIYGFSQLGSLGSYLEPLFVPLPGPDVTVEDIQQDVMNLIYAGAILSAVLFVAIVVYYPSKPPSPPSFSSTTERVDFIEGLMSVVKNKRLMVVVATYGVYVGPPIAWITVLDFSLLPLGFHQDKSMWIGCLAVVASSVSPIVSGRINDLLQGNLKALLITLMLGSTFFFYWFLLLSYNILEITDWQVFVSVIGGCACNYAALPLFLEVAADIAFPVPDVVVTGVMTFSDCVFSTLFLTGYSIPGSGYLWITSVLTITSFLAIIPLLFLKFDYTRANLDTANENENSI